MVRFESCVRNTVHRRNFWFLLASHLPFRSFQVVLLWSFLAPHFLLLQQLPIFPMLRVQPAVCEKIHFNSSTFSPTKNDNIRRESLKKKGKNCVLNIFFLFHALSLSVEIDNRKLFQSFVDLKDRSFESFVVNQKAASR